jgi:anaerobic magnesium-protoporphyrin IX monomethyl ester cyclase
LKVVLINPNINVHRTIVKNTSHPPLGLAYLAAVLEKNNINVTVLDAFALKINYSQLQKYLKKNNPDVIGITGNIASCSVACQTAVIIRKTLPGSKIIFGGPWPSIDFEYILKNGFADYVVIGEAEHTLPELLEKIKNNKPVINVKGISYKNRGDSVITTRPRELIVNLDDLPFPAWHLFPSPDKYYFYSYSKIFYPVTTSRGCPHDCIYCTKYIHGYKMRYRSVENIIDEIRYLKDRFSVEQIQIVDDNFLFDQKRAELICGEIIKRKFNLKIEFSNGLRAEKLTAHLAQLLKKAGTFRIALGIESGNQHVLDKINKKLRLDQIRKAVDLIKGENIELIGYFILGHPYDTPETMNDTINLAIELDPQYALFFKMVPFPGTKLFKMIQMHGKFLKEVKENIQMGYYWKDPMFEIYNLKGPDVELAYKNAYKRFYFRPAKILKLLANLKSFSEFKVLFNRGFLALINILGPK